MADSGLLLRTEAAVRGWEQELDTGWRAKETPFFKNKAESLQKEMNREKTDIFELDQRIRDAIEDIRREAEERARLKRRELRDK